LSKILALIVLSVCCAPFAKADGGTPVYDISGTVTLPATTGSEVVNFSFQVTYTVFDGQYYLSVLPGGTANGSGPINGPLELGGVENPSSFVAGPGGKSDINWMATADAGGDSIDIYFSSNDYVSNPPAPAIVGGYLYSCGTTACLTSLCPEALGLSCPKGGEQLGIDLIGTVESTTTVATPEPSALALLTALLLVFLAARPCRGYTDIIVSARSLYSL